MGKTSGLSAKQEGVARLEFNVREIAGGGGGEGEDAGVDKRCETCVDVIVDLNVCEIVVIEP